ncbi:MAG: hypothetical protein P8J87_06565 [Verrucomicrobiales bacterium]|nr:hypothetical protein [Verrucomicrobiales bacterium]
MKITFLATVIAASTWFATVASAEMRTWTQANNGKTIEAEFVKFEAGKITIKFASGKTRSIDANLFVKADQEFAENFQMELDAEKTGTTKVANSYEEAILWDVHMCCNGCVDRIKKTTAKIKGATTLVDRAASTIVVRSQSKDTIQKIFDAVAAAGFYGEATSNFGSLQITAPKGGTSAVESATFSGVHLCCDDCVETLNTAIGKVAGVSDFTVKKSATSFTVTGNFKPADLIKSINKVGMNATLK